MYNTYTNKEFMSLLYEAIYIIYIFHCYILILLLSCYIKLCYMKKVVLSVIILCKCVIITFRYIKHLTNILVTLMDSLSDVERRYKIICWKSFHHILIVTFQFYSAYVDERDTLWSMNHTIRFPKKKSHIAPDAMQSRVSFLRVTMQFSTLPLLPIIRIHTYT